LPRSALFDARASGRDNANDDHSRRLADATCGKEPAPRRGDNDPGRPVSGRTPRLVKRRTKGFGAADLGATEDELAARLPGPPQHLRVATVGRSSACVEEGTAFRCSPTPGSRDPRTRGHQVHPRSWGLHGRRIAPIWRRGIDGLHDDAVKQTLRPQRQPPTTGSWNANRRRVKPDGRTAARKSCENVPRPSRRLPVTVRRLPPQTSRTRRSSRPSRREGPHSPIG
jgi:hypothetical protein